MGSVKDLQIIAKPTPTAMGTGRFLFSDRYSVFDWGEMPDHIEGKGAALCLMGAYCFEQLEKLGVKTHYRGLVNAEGKAVKIGDLKEPSSIMESHWLTYTNHPQVWSTVKSSMTTRFTRLNSETA
jgi:phosphoribosylaminoimidazole-succinocarboxamide synthase